MIISNATPLIAFARIHQLEILHAVTHAIIIPQAVAESLRLPVLGSVGILIRAKQMGRITQVKPYLDEMVRCGIRYSQRFITSILQQFGEMS